MAEEKGVWRTIKGRRVFIREGEDLASAMKRSGKFDNLKSEYINKLNDISKREYENKIDKTEYDKEVREATEDYKKEKAYRDYVKRTLNNDEYLKANRPNEYFQKQLRESGVKTFADEIKENKKRDLNKINSDGYHYNYDESIDMNSKELKNSLQETKRKADEWRIQHGQKPIFSDKEKGMDNINSDYKNANEGIMKERKIVSDWENGTITTDIALKRFKGDKERATKIFESMGYHSPFKDKEDYNKVNEKTTISFGKVDAYGNGRKANELTIDMKLEDGKFTASGNIWNSKHTDIISGGQNLDEMRTYLKGNKEFENVYNMWKKHHLNDMHAGTIKQEEALEKKFGGVNASKYSEQVEYLKSIGLYEDEGYKFGTGWLKRDIPEEDLKNITNIIRSNNSKNSLAKMSLSELRQEAQKYNIDTTGLSKQKLMAKLIAIFK